VQHLDTRLVELGNARGRVLAEKDVGAALGVEPAVWVGEDVEFDLADPLELELIREGYVRVLQREGELRFEERQYVENPVLRLDVVAVDGPQKTVSPSTRDRLRLNIISPLP
jgi:hypothetical protein